MAISLRGYLIRDFDKDIAVGDLADKASLDLDRSIDSEVASIRWQSRRSAEIAEARKRNGTFGFCVDCGQEIPRKRLKADSSAIRCCGCQEELERPPKRRR